MAILATCSYFAMTTATQIEQWLGLPDRSLTISTDDSGNYVFSPQLTDAQLALVKVRIGGPTHYVPAWRMRAIAKRHNLIGALNSLVATLPKDQRDVVEEQLASSNIERGHPFVAAFAASAGLTEDQVDALFVEMELLV